jgi:hypothetical protein
MGKPISVGTFPFGGSANRFRLELSPLGDPSTEIGWSFPLWGIRQPEALFMSLDAESHTNQYVEPLYLKFHQKASNPNLWLL